MIDARLNVSSLVLENAILSNYDYFLRERFPKYLI